jgi:hypothetical protein
MYCIHVYENLTLLTRSYVIDICIYSYSYSLRLTTFTKSSFNEIRSMQNSYILYQIVIVRTIRRRYM